MNSKDLPRLPRPVKFKDRHIKGVPHPHPSMHHPITSTLPRSASFNKDLRTDSGTRQQNTEDWLHSDLVTVLLYRRSLQMA